MTVGAVKPFAILIASGVTLSSATDLGGSYKDVAIAIPTMPSGTDVFLRGSDEIDGTFRRLYHPSKVDSTTPTLIQIDSSITNCIVPVPFHVRHVKVELTTAMTDSVNTFKLICSS